MRSVGTPQAFSVQWGRGKHFQFSGGYFARKPIQWGQQAASALVCASCGVKEESCCAPRRHRGQTFSIYKRYERQARAVASDGCHDAARGSSCACPGSRGWKRNFRERRLVRWSTDAATHTRIQRSGPHAMVAAAVLATSPQRSGISLALHPLPLALLLASTVGHAHAPAFLMEARKGAKEAPRHDLGASRRGGSGSATAAAAAVSFPLWATDAEPVYSACSDVGRMGDFYRGIVPTLRAHSTGGTRRHPSDMRSPSSPP